MPRREDVMHQEFWGSFAEPDPLLQLLRPDGSETSLLEETRNKRITLLCLAFRSGAEVQHFTSFSRAPVEWHCLG